MIDTMSRFLVGLGDAKSERALRPVLTALVDRLSTQPLTVAAPVINAGGATFPKIGAVDFYASVQGVLVKILAGAALPALTGINVTAANFNVACYFVDLAGTLTVFGGTQATTLAGVRWPIFPLGKALVGILIIPGAFTGGTTALDGVATVYLSPQCGFDPTTLV